MQDTPATQCVLRICSGPLQGCEFLLRRRRTLFVVGAEAEFCSPDRPVTIPEDAIYIPLGAGGSNFEVLLEDNGRSGCFVRVLGDEESVERPLPFQSLECVGGVHIAVRLQEEPWREGVIGNLLSTAQPESFQAAGTWRQRLVAGSGIALLVGLTMVAWYASSPNPVSNVEALIAGGNARMPVVYGRDRTVYVFAGSEREANWGRQVLVRNGYAATQVMTVYDERGRLENLLARLAPEVTYHQLDLSDPTVPRLLVSQQRNVLSTDSQRQLEKALTAAAPYAQEVQIIHRDDDELVHQAEEGLKRLALPFTRIKENNSVTFMIEGSLQDAELKALSNYVVEFTQKWGGHYVHFAIELKDDWLKGKSFQYGPQGYVKMTPSSWYFPKPL
jgi:type III secretion system PrgH/EprH family protein